MKGSDPRDRFFFRRTEAPGRPSRGSWRPNTDVYETDESVVVALEVPGVNPEDLEVTQHHDRLVVRGVKHPRFSGEARLFHQIEIPCGEFEKEIILPPGLRGARVEATLALGILSLKIDRSRRGKGPSETKVIIEAQ